MANFLGAAFGFGARDVGFEAAMGSATKNLDKVNNLLDVQNEKGSKSGKIWKSIGEKVKQFNIASIASSMRDLTGETGNLSNGLESMAVSYSQSTKPIIASMNLTGKEARKMNSRVVGMAIGLNTSADAVAETFKAIHGAGGPAKAAIDAMGMSEKDWVKTTQTTGVTMQDYAAMLGDMVASWGASDKQAGQMINNIMAIGKAAKVGTSAIKGAKGQLDAIDVIFEQLPPSMARSADEIQSLMESTYKLAGAFREMGETEEQATALGQDTAKMFAEQAVKIEKLYKMGGEGALDDSPLFRFLTQLGIGTEEARDIINEGSRDVVGGVSRINSIFAKMGGDSSPMVQNALAELNSAMGQSAAGLGWLASNTDTGTKSLAAMAAMTVKGEGALKKYGQQAYSSGRTLQESFDLAKESFETQVRSIARSNVKGLVGKQMKAYKEVGKELKNLGKDEIWGPLMNAVSIFDQMGPRGVFLAFGEQLGLDAKEASKMGVKFEFVFDKIKALGGALGPVMEMMGMFGPLGLAAGGVVGFFMLDDKERKKIWDTIKPMWEKFVKVWDEKIVPAAKEAWESIASWVARSWPGWWEDKIKPAIIGVMKGFSEEGDIGHVLFDSLKDLFKTVWKEFGVGGVAAMVGIGAIATGQGSTLGSALGGIIQGGLGALPWDKLLSPTGIIGGGILAGGILLIKAFEYQMKGYQDRILASTQKALDHTREIAKIIRDIDKKDRERRKKKEQEAKVKGGVAGLAGMATEDIQAGLASGAITKGGEEAIMKREGINWEKFIAKRGKMKGGTQAVDTEYNKALAKEFERRGGLEEGSFGFERLEATGHLADIQKSLNVLQEIPEVQERLKEAYEKGPKELAQAILDVKAAYQPMLNELQADLDIRDEQMWAMIEAYETGMSIDKRLPVEGGEEVMGAFGQGLGDETSIQSVQEGTDRSVNEVKKRLGGSLPEAGPLAGTPGQNPAYFGGRSVMEEFASGIESSTDMVRESMEKVLNDSVLTAMDEYGKKVKDLAEKKSIMAGIAKAIVRDFAGTGKMDMGTVNVEGEGTLNAKETFEAALNIPGLAGVIAAIVTDGHQTRVLLKKIQEDTHSIAESDLVKKTRVTGAGQLAVLPS